jgi:ABC-type multidrug transport system ATPase subunit
MSTAHHLSLADHIIILDQEGKIAEQGTWEDLRAEAGYISKIMLKKKKEGEDKTRHRSEGRNKTQIPPEQPNSSMQDIARKTGDVTLYSTLPPWLKRIIGLQLTRDRLLLQRHRTYSPPAPLGLTHNLRHLTGCDPILA